MPTAIPQNTLADHCGFPGPQSPDRHACGPSPAAFAKPQTVGRMKTLESNDDYKPPHPGSPRCASMGTTNSPKASISISGVRATAFAVPSNGRGTPWFTPRVRRHGLPATRTACLVRLRRFRCDLKWQCDRHDAQHVVVPRATQKGPSVPARCRRSRCRKTPPPLANNFQKIHQPPWVGDHLLGGQPTHALDDPMAYWKSLYPNTTTQSAPGITWGRLDEGNCQAICKPISEAGLGSMTYSGKRGCALDPHRPQYHPAFDPARRVNTARSPADAGTKVTQRSYNDRSWPGDQTSL